MKPISFYELYLRRNHENSPRSHLRLSGIWHHWEMMDEKLQSFFWFNSRLLQVIIFYPFSINLSSHHLKNVSEWFGRLLGPSFSNSIHLSTNPMISLNGEMREGTETLDSCSCCLILSHIIRFILLIGWSIKYYHFLLFNSFNLHTGQMISEMLGQGYDISATKLISFTHASAAEFLEVYKGVVPFYKW